MCKFTRIEWPCGHQRLSKTPEHTLLCNKAKEQHFQQGINCAPAECHPLSEDIESLPDDSVDSKIAQTICFYDFCDECKTDPIVVQRVRTGVTSPGIREVASRVISPEESGSYSEGDAEDLKSLHVLWTLCTNECKLAIQNFEEALGTQPEPVQTDIRATLTNIMGPQLLTPDASIHGLVLTQSIKEASFLAKVLQDYMRIGVPRSMSSKLADMIREKYHHTDARRINFRQLVEYIKCYNLDPSAYKIAIEHIAKQLARSLGHEYEYDPREDAHLKTRKWVDEHTPAFPGCCYTPRSSFTVGKKRKALRDAPKRAENINWPLRVDTELARNPPPGTVDTPERFKDPEIVYIKGLATRTMLRPLDIGQGPWGIRDVLSDEGIFTLLARLERANEPLRNESRTVAGNATFMGEPLPDSDSDDEVGEKESDEVDETGEDVNKTGEEVGKNGEEVGETGEKIDESEEEFNDQEDPVLLSDEQMLPRKRSRQDDSLRKRMRLEWRA